MQEAQWTAQERLAMNEWKEVDPNRPPSGEVIVAFSDGWVTAADYAAGLWWRHGTALSGRPTHYQPMPKHPTVSGDS